MKRSITLIACLSFSLCLHAQSFILYGDKAIGGNREDQKPTLSILDPAHFLISGFSRSGVNGDKTEDICDSLPVSNGYDEWVLKIDTGFNVMWDKDYGGEYSEDKPNVYPLSGNHFIYACASASDSACNKTSHRKDTVPEYDYWVWETDSDGTILWDKTYGSLGNDYYPSVTSLSTGDFIVCGISTATGIGGDKTVNNYGASDYWILKLDNNGNKIWDNVYGGNSNEGGSTLVPLKLIPEPDGSFIIGGITESTITGTVTQPPRGQDDVWIIKIDSTGTPIWDRRYGGLFTEGIREIIRTNDNGYIACSMTNSPQGGDISEPSHGAGDFWIIKLDSMGYKQWDRRYGGSGIDVPEQIAFAPGGGYWILGETTSNMSGDVSENGYGGNDYWILKIDDAGNKLWDKRFGGPGDDHATNFVIMPDSSIYLSGTASAVISPVKTDSGRGNLDYWLVHFKYTDPVFVGISETARSIGQLLIQPNPAKDAPLPAQLAMQCSHFMIQQEGFCYNKLLTHKQQLM